jgi:hypothetical protein
MPENDPSNFSKTQPSQLGDKANPQKLLTDSVVLYLAAGLLMVIGYYAFPGPIGNGISIAGVLVLVAGYVIRKKRTIYIGRWIMRLMKQD